MYHTRARWTILTLLLSATIAAGAAAQGKVDFSGTWELDLDASDPVDDLLKAQGRSWMERKLAARTKITQIITQSATEMRIAVTSSVMDREEVLRLDGTPMTRKTLKGDEITVTTRWSKDNKALLSETTVQTESGPAKVVSKRTLKDGGKTMVVETTMTVKGGKVFRARRIFRKRG